MSLIKMLEDLAERTPQPELKIYYTVAPFPRCAHCRDFDVKNEGDICEQCTREKLQGYEVLAMLGRLSNGFESDHGTRFHAVKFGSRRAMCGAQPGKRSVGWTFDAKSHGKEVTCPRCIKRLSK